MKKGELKYAPLWKRTTAFVIDSLIIGFIILFPIRAAIKRNGYMQLSESILASQLSAKIIIVGIIAALITIFYFSLLEYKLHQTVGKMIMRIQIISQTKNFTFAQCFMRNITKFSTALLSLDVLYMIIRRSHQRFLENITKTEVIEITNHDSAK